MHYDYRCYVLVIFVKVWLSRNLFSLVAFVCRSLRSKAAYEQATMPIPGYMYPAESMYGDVSLKYAGLKTGQGNYAHIWELKQQALQQLQQQQRYPATLPPRGSSPPIATDSAAPMGETGGENLTTVVEGRPSIVRKGRDRHFYESPRLEQLAADPSSCLIASDFAISRGQLPYYHELDSNNCPIPSVHGLH